MRFTRLSPSQDRAIHELRQGRPLAVRLGDGNIFHCTAIDPAAHVQIQESGFILLSGPRAVSLGYADPSPIALPIPVSTDPEQLRFLMQAKVKVDVPPLPLPGFAEPLLALAKQGRLIPALYVYPATESGEKPHIHIDVSEMQLDGPPIELRRVSTVRIPLHIGGHHIDAQATLFSTGVVGEEPLVMAIGDIHGPEIPLVRLHSACLTGDVFGSLRCDCGPQLHKAMGTMNDQGLGCVLYLPQEGRDTGIHNKLRAYALQDAGLDTVDADATLGFEPDERDFAMAGALLRDMGLTKIKLLTNNPDKVAGLKAEGIEVVERVPLQIPSQEHNHAYLHTKATKAGHYLPGE